jgi:ATP-binding cassette subfamily C protein
VLASSKSSNIKIGDDSKISVSEGKTAQRDPSTVVFENVTFKYPDATIDALSDVSFEIQPGSQVGLIGSSGAGKSTIADLMCGVLAPTSGVIRINTALSRGSGTVANVTVGYVPQRPGMVSGTIAENVALGESPIEVNRESVMAALEAANLTEIISNLPDGIDTQLGKLQDGLSGGQMQRIGLARALYLQPSLLVMDEATSALDAQSEGEIRKALDAMKGKVTLVIIAHRLNTIQHVDEVFYLENGQVKDSGKFQELVSRNPSIARTVSLMKVEQD